MRFYTESHAHDCGIDLHAKTMYLCILDREGQVLLHENITSRPEAFLEAVSPCRDDLVVAVECMFTWYWLADLCRREGIEFVLGHALYRKAIHGGKAKSDRIDAYMIASLLRGGNLPQAYVYPPELRATRDLLRRRLTGSGGEDRLPGRSRGRRRGLRRARSRNALRSRAPISVW